MDRWDIPIDDEPEVVSRRLSVKGLTVEGEKGSGFTMELESDKVTLVNRDGVVSVKEEEKLD